MMTDCRYCTHYVFEEVGDYSFRVSCDRADCSTSMMLSSLDCPYFIPNKEE